MSQSRNVLFERASLSLAMLALVCCAAQAPEQVHREREAYDPGFDGYNADEPPTAKVRDCTAKDTELARSDGQIGAIFSGSVDNLGARVGRIYRVFTPTVDRKGGRLHVMARSVGPPYPQSGGVAMRFAKCIDASEWKGVQFTIRGVFRGCSLYFAASDVLHEDRNAPVPFATGARESRPPETEIGQSWATEAAQVVRVPFEADESTWNATPPLALDRSKLTSLLWKLSDTRSGRCEADLVIDDISFY